MKQRSPNSLHVVLQFISWVSSLSKQKTLQHYLKSVFFQKVALFSSYLNLFKHDLLAASKTSHACKALSMTGMPLITQGTKGLGKRYPKKLAPSNEVRCSIYMMLFKPSNLNQTEDKKLYGQKVRSKAFRA